LIAINQREGKRTDKKPWIFSIKSVVDNYQSMWGRNWGFKIKDFGLKIDT
jgi:hypothetical protein